MHTKDVLRNGRRSNLFTCRNKIQYIGRHIDTNIVKQFIFADDNPSVLLKMMSFSPQEQFYASNINPPFTTITLKCLNIININTLFLFKITSFLLVQEWFWLEKCDEENEIFHMCIYIFFCRVFEKRSLLCFRYSSIFYVSDFRMTFTDNED